MMVRSLSSNSLSFPSLTIISGTAPEKVVREALASTFVQANAGHKAMNQDPKDPNYDALQKLLFPDEPGWPRVNGKRMGCFPSCPTEQSDPWQRSWEI